MSETPEIRGSEPGMTTKDMIAEIYSWAVVEKASGLPARMTDLEKWQNRVIGGVAAILALNLLDRVAVYLQRPVIEAAAAIIAAFR